MSFGIKRTNADKYFSDYIREKADWICERCKRNFSDSHQTFAVSHYWSRRNKSVRFDEKNVAALCFSCHQVFTENPGDHRDFFIKRLGQKEYDLLEARAKTPQKIDEKSVVMVYKALLKELRKPVAYRDENGHL